MSRIEPVEILLVEDNPSDVELTIRALKKRGLANNLLSVEDGAEALDYLFARGKYEGRNIGDTPKVVLLDLQLPKIDGLDVLRTLRADERTKTIPVVVLTSSKDYPDIETAYSLGVNSYVVKPIQFDDFVEAVGSLGLYWLLVNHPPE